MLQPKLSKQDEQRWQQLAGPSVIERFFGSDTRKQRLKREVKVKEKTVYKRETRVKEYYP